VVTDSDEEAPGALSRRRFLARGLAFGAASVGGLAACGGSSKRRLPASGDSAFARLARQLEGRVLVPGSPGYDSARLVFNARYDDVRPLAIVEAAGAEDVTRTIAFVQDHGVPLVSRSGGHSLAGYSTGPGIVLDVSHLNRITLAASGASARVGAGAQLIQVLTQLGRADVAVPAGLCPTVGIAGLTLGGGIGRMSRKHGLTLDALRRIRLVDASGRRITADASTHTDLFWACRGGGGGNFGIVTEFEFDVVPLDTSVTVYDLAWPWSHREQAFESWQQWSRASPPEFQSSLTLSTSGPSGKSPSVGLEGTYLGAPDKAAPHLAELEASVGVAPTTRKLHTTDYVTAIKDAFCEGINPEYCVAEASGGVVKRFGLSIKSTFVHGTWPAAALDVISEWLDRRQRDPLLTREPAAMNLGKIWFDALGGAAASVPSDATAFVHRDASFCAQYQSRWNVGAPRAVKEANLEWLRGFHAAMAEWNRGAYVNYSDPDLRDYAQQYYGANLARLEQVKRAYDPHDFFRFPQSIPG
jgi:FAD/FMN-containing dehydrogenase